MDIKELITKLSKIENYIDIPVYEEISYDEQIELTTLFLKLKDLSTDPRYASYPEIQNLNKELDRYNNAMRDADNYFTQQTEPAKPEPPKPEPAKPEPAPAPAPANTGGNTPSNDPKKIMDMQKELKTAGADLGAFGPNKDGIDGKLGGKNSKTRLAMQKFPDIAKKYNFTVANQAAMKDPKAQATAVNTTGQQSMNDNDIAVTLFRSMSGIGTNPEKFNSAISQIKTRQQFANVAAIYKKIAGEDLMAAIEGDFSGTELANIQNMLSKFQPKKESSELDRIKHLSGI